MAITAKVDFMNELEKGLSSEITANSMAAAMKIVADVLEGFELVKNVAQFDEKDDFLECYTEALKVQGRSAKTIERYKYVITRMMKAVGVSTRRVTVYHLRSYLAAEKERGVQEGTLEGIRQCFTAYFNWLQRESLIDRNPTANLGAIKCPKKKKLIYSNREIDMLRSGCKTLRNRAILEFLISTGCRISEVTGLNRDQIDFQRSECIVHGKGNKERTVFINDVTSMVLQRYLSERHDFIPALFISARMERITPGGVRCMLKELAQAVGVEHVHPHKFRRTLATNMARHGMPIQEVASILGHDKIDTTMKYVMLDTDDVKHDYRRYA